MTKEELKKMPVGIIEKRKLVTYGNGNKIEETYYLLKSKDNKYYVSFSESARSMSQCISEDYMLKAINDEDLSSNIALDIFAQDVHLNCMID